MILKSMNPLPRPRTLVALVAVAACVLLAGCGDIPDFRDGGGLFARNTARRAPLAGAPLGAPTPGADAAESACLQAGHDAGFDVRGVVGTREVLGDGGLAQSRDVMLRVQRGGQSVELRCSYAYLTGEARIMTL